MKCGKRLESSWGASFKLFVVAVSVGDGRFVVVVPNVGNPKRASTLSPDGVPEIKMSQWWSR